jgi:phosphate starvation-inducible protein PhoH
MRRLRSIEGIKMVHLKEGDIVRNPLVQRIVMAYEKLDDGKHRSSRTNSATVDGRLRAVSEDHQED